ncbi:hypothetical protein [Patulibacter minatonensis]|uniref:hypothetical protein n=1 Tax=Patulibacter minatonensis TaxID=298163 RepID=UPI00047E01D0|nr:hypothetical protein [Patulibacter minatonensis]
MDSRSTRRPVRRAPDRADAAVRCPPHLPADRAAAWSALRLALDATGAASVSAPQVAEWLRAIDPAAASRPLRVELLLEALAVDARTTVVSIDAFGDQEPGYAM